MSFVFSVDRACMGCACVCLCARGEVLSLILYADGVCPGAVLAADQRRKFVVWYCSFLELHLKLSYEEMWISIAIARTCVGARVRTCDRKWR